MMQVATAQSFGTYTNTKGFIGEMTNLHLALRNGLQVLLRLLYQYLQLVFLVSIAELDFESQSLKVAKRRLEIGDEIMPIFQAD